MAHCQSLQAKQVYIKQQLSLMVGDMKDKIRSVTDDVERKVKVTHFL